jgi:hypothetical protein
MSFTPTLWIDVEDPTQNIPEGAIPLNSANLQAAELNIYESVLNDANKLLDGGTSSTINFNVGIDGGGA